MTSAPIPFQLPDVGEGVAEAEIDQWYVAVGDRVEVDAPLVAVLTDKATLDISSPFAGTVVELAADPGDVVAVGSVLVRFAETDLPSDDEPDPPSPSDADEPTTADEPMTADEPSADPAATASPVPPVEPGPTQPVAPHPPRRVLASPSVRRVAAEAGIDLRLVRGSGPVGRVTHADLAEYAATPSASAPATTSRRRTGVTDVAVTGVRRAIARQMVTSTSRIPHITLIEEVDVEVLESLRSTLNERRSQHAPHLTPLAFVIHAVARSVEAHPAVNARFDDEANVVQRHDAVHVGLATQTPDGLKVPVLRHAEALDLWETAAAISECSQAARNGQLSPADMRGSTITVSSLGALGGLANTPVINHPEVAIIGVNAMQVRPHWDGTTFVPRRKMNLSSSFDHRVVDGWDAAVFLRQLKDFLEEPALLFVRGA